VFSALIQSSPKAVAHFPMFFQATSVKSVLDSWSVWVSYIQSKDSYVKETPKQIQYSLCPAACSVELRYA